MSTPRHGHLPEPVAAGIETAEGGGGTLVLEAVSGQSLVIPGRAFILKADYARQGSDLVLRGGDGQTVIVRDFFAVEVPPNLLTEGGAMVTAELAARLAGPRAPAQYAQADALVAQAGAEPIGQVEQIEGDAYAVRTDGTRDRLSAGDRVFQGDVVESEAGSSLKVVFVDETVFTMGENARITLDELIYDPGGDANSGRFSVVQGVFAFVSGQVAKSGPDAMQIDTPVATIGIRGTVFVIQIEEVARFFLREGVIAALNNAGETILDQPGTGAEFASRDSPGQTFTATDELLSSVLTDSIRIPSVPGFEDVTGRDRDGRGGDGGGDGEGEGSESEEGGPEGEEGDEGETDSGEATGEETGEEAAEEEALSEDIMVVSVPEETFETLTETPESVEKVLRDITAAADAAGGAPSGTPVQVAAIISTEPPEEDDGEPAPQEPQPGTRQVFSWTPGDGDVEFPADGPEDAATLSGAPDVPNTFTVSAEGGEVVVAHSAAGTAASVVRAGRVGELTVRGGNAADQVQVADLSGTAITDNTLRLDGLGGDDDLDAAAAGKRVVLEGGAGSDRLAAGSGNDTIRGQDGNDTVTAGAGSDAVFGGPGDDDISAEAGDDVASGGPGNDTVRGGGGVDLLGGDVGDDVLEGGPGDDLLSGGPGNDDLSGGSGSDTLAGEGGDDRIDGGAGGPDFAVYAGSVFDFTFLGLDAASGSATVRDDESADGDLGTDTLTGVETAIFDDASLFLDGRNNAPLIAPVAEQSVDEDAPLVFSPDLGNVITVFDLDAGAQPLALALSVENGTLTLGNPEAPAALAGNGTDTVELTGTLAQINQALDGLTYLGDSDFNGDDTLTVTANDQGNTGTGGAKTGSRTIDIAVASLPDPPVAGDNADQTPEDQAITLSVLANDTDVDGDDLTVTGVSAPANGTAAINGDGTITYTPDADFNGPDAFTYTVSDPGGASDTATVDVDVTPVNDPPVAGDDADTTPEDQAITLSVLANDSDVDGDDLTVTAVSAPANGTAAINGDGTISYTPDADFNGPDAFTYTVSDPGGASDTATVNVQVTAVNDPPVAGDDADQTPEDQAITLSVLANDSDADGDNLTVTAVSAPANGTAAINGDGTITYTPDADFNGPDAFTYTVADPGGASDTATVNVQVTPVNDPPVADDDADQTPEDQAITLSVLGNDSDVDGDDLTVTGVSAPANGTAAINGDGTVTYTPDPDFNGSDTFTYTVSDPGGASDTATVNVQVTPVNDPPVADDDADQTPEDQAITLSVLVNDSDVDGDDLTVTGVSAPANGTAAINDDGTITYTPDADFNGSDTFTYTVSDPGGASDTATVDVDVTPVNDPPVAGDDADQTPEDQAITLSVLVNDSDVDGDDLTVTAVLDPANGTAAINDDRTITHTPDADFNGSDTFTYTVSDPGGASDTATVNVQVTAVNDAPGTNGPAAQFVDEEQPLVFSQENDNALTVFDPDAGDGALEVSLGVDSGTLMLGDAGAAATVAGDGSTDIVLTGTLAQINQALDGLTYVGSENFSGDDTLDVVVDDQGNTGSGGAKQASREVAITVNRTFVTGDVRSGGASASEPQVLSLGPKQTFLRISPSDTASPAAVIALSTLGLVAGDLLAVRSAGAMSFAEDGDEFPSDFNAVFSTSDVQSADQSLLNQVPGAIDLADGNLVLNVGIDEDIATGPTFENDLATDIAEDFGGRVSIVEVPNGASHLFVGVPDTFYDNNTDSDGDLEVRLSEPLVVGESGDGNLEVLGGESFTQDSIVLALLAGSTGTGLVSGAEATLTAGTIIVGHHGTASLTVENQAETVAETVRLGEKSNGDGTLEVDNAALTLSTSNLGLVIGQEGAGTFLLDNAGVADITSDGFNNVEIGAADGASGQATIRNDASLRTLGTDNTVQVGRGGTGSLNVESGGSLHTLQLELGREATGDGTATITGPDTLVRVDTENGLFSGSFGFEAGFVRLARDGTATLDVENGATLEVGPGTTNNTDTVGAGIQIARNAGSTGTMTVDGAATSVLIEQNGTPDLSAGEFGPFITAGRDGDGTFIARNGATVDINGSDAAFEVGNTGTGDAQILSGAQLTLDGGDGPSQVILGDQAGGDGTLTVSGGAGISTLWFNVGLRGTGTATISGDGSEVIASNDGGLFGGAFAFEAGFATVGRRPGSDGSLTIEDGGRLLIRNGQTQNTDTSGPGLEIGEDLDSSGTVTVAGTGSALDILQTSAFQQFGPFLSVGDALGTGTLTVEDQASVTLDGPQPQLEISAADADDADETSDIAQIQKSTMTVTTGATVTIEDTADSGNITLEVADNTGAKGELAISAGGQVINDTAGVTVVARADGTQGMVTVGGTNSLLDAGALLVIGANFAGGAVDFTQGGTATVTVNGDGRIEAGAALSDGTDDIVVGADGTFGGDGTAAGDVLFKGDLEPGQSAGTLTIEGDAAADRGRLVAEADGTAAGTFDTVAVGGSLDVTGGLTVQLTLDGAFNAAAGAQLDVMTAAGGLIGGADDVALEVIGIAANDLFNVEVDADSIGLSTDGGAGAGDTRLFRGSSFADTFVGGDGDDRAFGAAGDDSLTGGAGDDLLEGQAGNDILTGNAGNDSYEGGDGDDQVFGGSASLAAVDPFEFFLAGLGDDTYDLGGGVDFDILDYSGLIGRPVTVTVGNETASVVKSEDGTDTVSNFGKDGLRFVLTPGNDSFDASGGAADTAGAFISVKPGDGVDTVTGVAGIFTEVSYDDAPFAITANLADGTVEDGFGDIKSPAGNTDTVSNIDRVGGTNLADSFTGSNGNDSFRPRQGDDTVDGGGGSDEVDYRNQPGNVAVDLGEGMAFLDVDADGNVDFTQTLTSIERVRGTDGDDSLTGSAADGEVFRPRGGADTIDGLGGRDTVSYAFNNDAGVTVDLSIGEAVDGLGDTDSISNIENATGTQFADTLKGDGQANVLTGLGEDDTLAGGDGNDTLYGDLAPGDDPAFYAVSSGDDRLLGGLGADQVTTGPGSDTVVFTNPNQGKLIGQDGTTDVDAADVNSITDFVSGTDTLELDAAAFGFDAGLAAPVEGTHIFTLPDGEQFDGTNAGTSGSEPASGEDYLALDDTGTLYHDDDKDTEGYTLVTNSDGDTFQASDVQFA